MTSDINVVLAEVADEWMGIDGVVLVGHGEADGGDCILVMVDSRVQEIREALPSEVRGFAVRVEESGGSIDAQQAPEPKMT